MTVVINHSKSFDTLWQGFLYGKVDRTGDKSQPDSTIYWPLLDYNASLLLCSRRAWLKTCLHYCSTVAAAHGGHGIPIMASDWVWVYCANETQCTSFMLIILWFNDQRPTGELSTQQAETRGECFGCECGFSSEVLARYSRGLQFTYIKASSTVLFGRMMMMTTELHRQMKEEMCLLARCRSSMLEKDKGTNHGSRMGVIIIETRRDGSAL